MIEEEPAPDADLSELRAYINSIQEENPAVGACRRLANTVAEWCTEQFGADNVTLRQGYFRGGDKVAQHFYVVIDYQDRRIVADPTVSQFTQANWVEGKADTYVPPDEIPAIGVIDDSMAIFSRYE